MMFLTLQEIFTRVLLALTANVMKNLALFEPFAQQIVLGLNFFHELHQVLAFKLLYLR